MRKQNNVGFTLIELLVVVLIIGILAAVALPQYTKAVERSRTAEALQRLGDLATAQQIYYMANGKFAGNKDNLDLTFADLNTSSYTVTMPTAETTSAIDLVATRGVGGNGGIYNGCTLTLNVAPSGALDKTCNCTSSDANKTAFCGLVASAGYSPATSTSSDDDDE